MPCGAMMRTSAIIDAHRSQLQAFRPHSRSPEPDKAGTWAARKTCRVKYFIGVRGDIVTQSDLPSPRTKRWVIRRKAENVLAVEGGLLSLEDACQRYQQTHEEFSSWKNAVE